MSEKLSFSVTAADGTEVSGTATPVKYSPGTYDYLIYCGAETHTTRRTWASKAQCAADLADLCVNSVHEARVAASKQGTHSKSKDDGYTAYTSEQTLRPPTRGPTHGY